MNLPKHLQILFVSVVYFLLAVFSLQLSYKGSNATPVWPPSGFAFAMILLWGRSIAPGVFLGALSANLFVFLSHQTVPVFTAIWASATIGMGNTAEALAGYFLLDKLLPSVKKAAILKSVPSVFYFLLAALVMCIPSCTIGVMTTYIAGIVNAANFQLVWFTWWTGDVSGILVLTPLIIAWSSYNSQGISTIKRASVVEACLCSLGILISSGIVFHNWFNPSFLFTRAFIIIPFLIWAAIRFKHQLLTVLLFVLAVITVAGTMNGIGPLIGSTLNESLLTAEAFISVNALMALVLNAAIMERKNIELSLRAAKNNLEATVAERTKELLASHAQLAEAQRMAHMGSWSWDVKKDVITWSDELHRVYGLEPDEFNGTFEGFIKLIHDEDRDFIALQIENSFKNKESFSFYHRILRPDGAVRILLAHGDVCTDDKGDVIRMTGTGQDVTERKMAEELLKKVTKELQEKNRELERSNQELASFSYIASHDLQEPLRKLNTFTDKILYTEKHLSDTGKELFKKIQAATLRMKELIENLLAYSQVDSARELLAVTDLNTVLRDVKNDLGDTILNTGAIIDSCILPTIRVVPFQFQQLFTNLLSNALKFRRPGIAPHIIIESELVPRSAIAGMGADDDMNYHHISISDNGIGFDQQYAHKIFEIFQRLHAQSEYKGTGVGLAICRKIVENHGGVITASSELPFGAAFHIYLPVDDLENAAHSIKEIRKGLLF